MNQEDEPDEETALMIHYRQLHSDEGNNSNKGDGDVNIDIGTPGEEDIETEEEKKEEKRFLRRLDCILITYVWISYCIKQIDASNYKTAYVSGMKEDLSLHGNELNYIDSLFRIGYAISIIPSSLLLSTYRPSLLLPSLELIWGITTALMSVATSPTLIYISRLIIGLCEASSYPGTITILMNWYTPSELSTRMALFGTSYPAANIFVGSMQAALWKGLHGTRGMAGWRWLFLLNGIMTIVVALAGYIIIPDSPMDTKAWWIESRGREISKRRMQRAGKIVGRSGAVLGFREWCSLARRLLGEWRIWAFGSAYAAWSWGQNANAWYPLYLKWCKLPDGTPRFTVEQVNLIPIPAFLLHGAAMLVFSHLSDRKQQRGRWVLAQLIPHLMGCLVLAIWPPSFWAQMLAIHLLFISNAAGPIILAWMADETGRAPEERTVMVAVMVTLVYAVDCWANIFLWPAKEAPRYRVGYWAAAGWTALSMGMAGWVKYKVSGNRSVVG
ncbi:putative transporter [Pyronema omphalodes]|nr:putative transporter [Pyronema omphalodes]